MANRWRYRANYHTTITGSMPNCDGLVCSIRLLCDTYVLSGSERRQIYDILEEIKRKNRVLPKERLFAFKQQIASIRSKHER